MAAAVGRRALLLAASLTLLARNSRLMPRQIGGKEVVFIVTVAICLYLPSTAIPWLLGACLAAIFVGQLCWSTEEP